MGPKNCQGGSKVGQPGTGTIVAELQKKLGKNGAAGIGCGQIAGSRGRIVVGFAQRASRMQTKLHRGGGANEFGLGRKRLPQTGQMSGRGVFLTYFLALVSLLCAGCKESKPEVELAQVLSRQSWARELGTGALQERHVFNFSTNGTYRQCVQNNFGMRAITGTWRLSRAKDGKVILHLENPEADYYCIWRESPIRYNKQRDVLVVSVERLGGEQELRPVSLTNKAPEIRQPPKPHTWHSTARTVRGCKPAFWSHRH